MTTTTTLIPAAGNATHRVVKVPALRHGDDAKFAAELEQYIIEAESGLRSIIKAGFFLEAIAEDLPRGQLGPWVEAHCKGRTWRTVQRWKEIASKLGEAIGISLKKRLALKCHDLLALPFNKLSAEQKPIREKLDAEIAGKSYRQLFMEFKQADEDDPSKPKRGRLKGQGGASKAQRLAAAEAEERARITEMELSAKDFGKWIDEVCDAKGLGKISDRAFDALCEKAELLWQFCRQLKAARKSGHSALCNPHSALKGGAK